MSLFLLFNAISLKPGKNSDIQNFLAKFSILAYISLKIGYFELGHDYVGTYFGIYGKRRPLAILWHGTNYIYGGSFSSSQWGGNHSP